MESDIERIVNNHSHPGLLRREDFEKIPLTLERYLLARKYIPPAGGRPTKGDVEFAVFLKRFTKLAYRRYDMNGSAPSDKKMVRTLHSMHIYAKNIFMGCEGAMDKLNILSASAHLIGYAGNLSEMLGHYRTAYREFIRSAEISLRYVRLKPYHQLKYSEIMHVKCEYRNAHRAARILFEETGDKGWKEKADIAYAGMRELSDLFPDPRYFL